MPYSALTKSNPVYLTTGVVMSGTPDNDGGLIRMGGTILSNRWSSKQLGDTKTRVFQRAVQFSLNRIRHQRFKALSGGTFNFENVAKTYVVRKLCITLAGQSKTAIFTGASDFGRRHSVHQIEYVRTSLLRSWSLSGAYEGAPVYSFTYGMPNSHDAGNDNAANPTRTTPGELVYMRGSKTPYQDDYKPKTNF